MYCVCERFCAIFTHAISVAGTINAPAYTVDFMDQRIITLQPRPRGFHLVTDEIVAQLPELRLYVLGLAHIHILHTSASLTINENADPTVRRDLESWFNTMVPEHALYFQHTTEGPDDMPAHIKSSVLGSSLVVPVRNGSFLLGVWQGVYLCEHRNHGGPRQLVITITGETEHHAS